MTTDFGRISVGPGTFDQGTPGMGIPGLGHAPLLTPSPTGIFRGREPQIMHELAGVREAHQVAEFGHRRHRHRALDTTQGWRASTTGAKRQVLTCSCSSVLNGLNVPSVP